MRSSYHMQSDAIMLIYIIYSYGPSISTYDILVRYVIISETIMFVYIMYSYGLSQSVTQPCLYVHYIHIVRHNQ